MIGSVVGVPVKWMNDAISNVRVEEGSLGIARAKRSTECLQQIYFDLMITSTPASFIDVDLCWSASIVVIIKYVGRGFLVALKIDVDVETVGRVAWKRSTKYQGRSVLRLKEASVTLRERS